MIIVCLDQCAISRLARSGGGRDVIDKLRECLLDASKDLRLICPVAAETTVETSGFKSAERRNSIYELHSRLADAHLGGPLWAFKNMYKLIKEETLALARSQAPPREFELIHWRSVDDDKQAAETWSGVLESKERMKQRVESHSLTLAAEKEVVDKTSKGIVLAVEHAGHVYRQLKRLLAAEELDEDDHMGYELAVYLREKRIAPHELEKLIQDILHHRWEAIPVIFNRTQITGQLELECRRSNSPRGYDVNDEFDIPRLAVGLSSADLIITDAPMAQLCHTVRTDSWSGAKVFAIRDAEKILSHLESVLATT
jgi:hypothetical protein